MDSGHEQDPRPTATAVAAPAPAVPAQRTAPPAETAPVIDARVETGPIATVTADAPPVTSPCRCGHDRDAHEHFRRGTDCTTCDCAHFRRPGPLARLRT